MNKFFALIIKNNLPKRIYMSISDVEEVLNNPEGGITVFRCSTDQIAFLNDGKVAWKDVVEEKYEEVKAK